MARSSAPSFSTQCLYLITLLCLLPSSQAQLGTMTQDLTTIALFGSQKLCAQECFVTRGSCTGDVLGEAIGCVPSFQCRYQGAKNDCFCRADLQKPALDYLSRCVSRSCSVGDAAIDMSTAGGLYQQYCSEKGYQTKPATVRATTTGTGAATGTAGGFADPTSPSSDSNQQSSTSTKTPLSTMAIVGIGVGCFIVLTVVLAGINQGCKPGGCLRRNPNTQFQQQQPFAQHYPQYGQQPRYPPQPTQEPYYGRPPASECGIPDSEIHPDESASVISPPRVANTLVSAVPAPYPPYNPEMPHYNQQPPPYQSWR